MLQEFSGIGIDSSSAVNSKVLGCRTGDTQQTASSVASVDGFNKELQDQMAALMGSLDEALPIQQEIGVVMRDLGSVADRGVFSEPGPGQKISTANAPRSSDAPFQETIQNTMRRMQASGDLASNNTDLNGSDELLSHWIDKMEDGSADGPAENEIQSLLMGMMEQLTNKEILYDPMKELHCKYPKWIEEHRRSTSNNDIERYQEQQQLVDEIVQRFESEDYADSNASDREFIVEKMQKVQLICQ